MIKKLFFKIGGILVLLLALLAASNANAASFGGYPMATPANATAGVNTNYRIDFRTSQSGSLVAGDQISIAFPAEFNIAGSTLAGITGITGNTSYNINGQNTVLTLDPGASLGNDTAVSVNLAGVINSTTAGSFNNLVITSTHLGNPVDGPTNTALFSIWPNAPNQDQSTITTAGGVATMVVGTNLNIEFTLRDQYGNVISNEDVAWSRSNLNFSISATSGTTDASGKSAITLTAPQIAGEQTTVTAQSGTVVHNITVTTQTITTIPDALHHWELSNITSAQTAGDGFNLLVTPKDQYNNTITNYDWTSPANHPIFSGLSDINGLTQYIFQSSSDGIATYQITTYTSQINVAITVNLGIVNGITNSFDVINAPAHHFTINAPADTTCGNAFDLTIAVYDQFNNPAINFSGTTILSGLNNAPNGQTPNYGNINFINGIATVSITGYATGTQTITATSDSVIGTSGNINFSAAALNNITITPSDDQSIVAGIDLSFTPYGFDQYGNEIPGLIFTWTNANNGIFNQTSVNNGNPYQVQAHSNGFDSNIVNVYVTPAALNHVVLNPAGDQSYIAGESATYIAQSFDIYGNEIISGVTYAWHGTDNATSGILSTTVAGVYNVWVTATEDTINKDSTTYQVTVNPASLDHWDLPQNISDQVAGIGFNFTISPLDQYGNLINTYDWSNPINHPVLSGIDGATYIYQSALNGVATYQAVTNLAQNNVAIHACLDSAGGDSNQFNITHNVLDHFEVVAPSDATAGTSFQITITAYDAFGNVVLNFSDQPILSGLLPSPNGDLPDYGGSITFVNGIATPWITAYASGNQSIIVDFNGITGTSNVIAINPGSINSIVISTNDPIIITAGGTVQFSTIVADQYGNIRTGDVLTWDNTDANGLFTNTTAGTYTVTAHSGGVPSNSVDVTVNPAATSQVVINPDTAQEVVAGNNLVFTATAFDQYGNPTGDVVTWHSATDGTFNETAAELYTVYASVGLIESTHVDVTVIPDILHHILITPDQDQSVTAGDTIQFAAVGYDQYDNIISGLTFIWDETDANGLFINSIAGTYLVQAHSDSVNSNIVNVIVNHAALDHIDISPQNYTLAHAGNTQPYTVTAYDIYDNGWDVTALASYGLSASDLTGTLTNNIYKGGTVGTHTITATYQGKSASTNVTVAAPGTTVGSVEIVNKISQINLGGTHQYQIRVKDLYDNLMSGQTIIWTITGAGGATIDANGLLTGTVLGNITVRAAIGSKYSEDDVEVVASGGVGGFTTNISDVSSEQAATPLTIYGQTATQTSQTQENKISEGQVAAANVETGKISAISTQLPETKNRFSYLLLLYIILGAAIVYFMYTIFLSGNHKSHTA